MNLVLVVTCEMTGRRLRAESMSEVDVWRPVWCGSCQQWHPTDSGVIDVDF